MRFCWGQGYDGATNMQGRSVGVCGGMVVTPPPPLTSSVDLHPVTFVGRELTCVDMT